MNGKTFADLCDLIVAARPNNASLADVLFVLEDWYNAKQTEIVEAATKYRNIVDTDKVRYQLAQYNYRLYNSWQLRATPDFRGPLKDRIAEAEAMTLTRPECEFLMKHYADCAEFVEFLVQWAVTATSDISTPRPTGYKSPADKIAKKAEISRKAFEYWTSRAEKTADESKRAEYLKEAKNAEKEAIYLEAKAAKRREKELAIFKSA